MNDFLKTLMNIRSLRAVLRELSYEQLVEAKDKFDEIYAEREQQESKLREESAERLQKLAEFTELLKQAGIDPSELVGTAAPAKAMVQPTKPNALPVLQNTSTPKAVRRRHGLARGACPRPLQTLLRLEKHWMTS